MTEVSVSSQEHGHVFVCIDFSPLYHFLGALGTVPTVWCFFALFYSLYVTILATKLTFICKNGDKNGRENQQRTIQRHRQYWAHMC